MEMISIRPLSILFEKLDKLHMLLRQSNNSVAAAKITEASALLRFFATKYEIDLESNIEEMYSKKISLFERNKEN